MATAGACLTSYFDFEATSCNPAIFAFHEEKSLDLNLIGKTAGSGIETLKKFVFQDIEKSFLSELFEENSFISWSGNSEISFTTPSFKLSYTPYYVLIDSLVFNPALPQVSLIILDRHSLSLTSGFELSEKLGIDKYARIGIGAGLSYHWDNYFRGSFNILDLALNDVEDVISFEKRDHFTASPSFIVIPNASWIPTFAITVQNLFSKYDVRESDLESPFTIETRNQFETVTRLGLGHEFYTKFGLFSGALQLPFEGFFGGFINSPSLSFTYDLDLFSLYVGIQEYSQTTGLYFRSPNTTIGILYSYERELKGFNVNRDDAIYLSISLGML